MVQVSRPPAEGGNLGNVMVGAFGLTGALVISALVFGVLLASVWILWRKFRRTYDSDAPPSLGPVPLSPDATTRPPSSPDQ